MPEQLVTIARYRDLNEALLAQGMLQAAGIAAELADDNIVRMDWFLSNMVGGIRLQVEQEQVDDAVEVLASPIPAELPGADDTEKYHQPACPKCGSLDVGHDTSREWISAAVLYLVSLPLPLPQAKSWRCWDCGAHWKEDGENEA